MAYHVRVALSQIENRVVVEGRWGHLTNYELFPVEIEPDMTAAESVEYYFLEYDMVPSWTWSSSSDGNELHCEFVYDDHPTVKNYKIVKNSNADKFDLQRSI